jgi:hypothetical protein
MKPASRRCSATTRRGTPCRRWATRDSDPPLCAAHGGHTSPSAPAEGGASPGPGSCFPALLPPEPDESPPQGGLSLDEEIALARACLQRIAEALKTNGKLTPEQRIRLAALIFRGASTIARLLRDRQAVSEQEDKELSPAVAQAVAWAVAEAARELGVAP